MKIVLTIALLLSCAAPALCQHAAGTTRQAEAQKEIAAGARAYKEGRFQEAQQHFERAHELDPESRNALFFIARAIHLQYNHDIDTAENTAIARSAIAAYERAFIVDPANDEAYNAIIYLYGRLKDETEVRRWLTARAENQQLPVEKRAPAYTLMARMDWNCSYAITERQEHRSTVTSRKRAITKYLKPKDEAEFDQAKQCAERGLELTERALNLDADNLPTWTYKTNLLLELVKLADMENNSELKADYQKRALDAQRRTSELSEQEKKKNEELLNQKLP